MKRTLILIALVTILVSPSKYANLFKEANDEFFKTKEAIEFVEKVKYDFNQIEKCYKEIKKEDKA